LPGTAAAVEFPTRERDQGESQREDTVPKTLGSRSPPRNNVPPRTCRKHNWVDCGACLNTIDPTHHYQAAAMIAICQNCGKHHPVIADACQSQETCHRMPAAKGTVEGKPATVLRDTGCSSIVVRRSLLPDKLTGQEALCILIDGTIRRTPVAEILVDTPYYRGLTTAVCMTNPIYDLIIGNVKGAIEPNPPQHLTGAMNVIFLDRPDSADNGRNQMTAAATPEENHITRGSELETRNPLQKETDGKSKVKPHEVTCYDARERTHPKLRVRTSEPSILRLPDIIWTLILLVVASLVCIGAVLWYTASSGESRSGAQIILHKRGRGLCHVIPKLFVIQSYISSKLLELETLNLYTSSSWKAKRAHQ